MSSVNYLPSEENLFIDSTSFGSRRPFKPKPLPFLSNRFLWEIGYNETSVRRFTTGNSSISYGKSKIVNQNTKLKSKTKFNLVSKTQILTVWFEDIGGPQFVRISLSFGKSWMPHYRVIYKNRVTREEIYFRNIPFFFLIPYMLFWICHQWIYLFARKKYIARFSKKYSAIPYPIFIRTLPHCSDNNSKNIIHSL